VPDDVHAPRADQRREERDVFVEVERLALRPRPRRPVAEEIRGEDLERGREVSFELAPLA
jgi:hypothetical protein